MSTLQVRTERAKHEQPRTRQEQLQCEYDVMRNVILANPKDEQALVAMGEWLDAHDSELTSLNFGD